MNNTIIFEAVEKAVQAASLSTHYKERVGACVFDLQAQVVEHEGYANIVPPLLEQHFMREARLGSSSIYLHSEIAALFACETATERMALAVTTPPCPNCAKLIVEAGISHIFIDANGANTHFAEQRENDIELMSKKILSLAGIQVFWANREERTITSFVDCVVPGPLPTQGLYKVAPNFDQLIKQFDGEAMAAALIAPDTMLVALEALPPGMTPSHYDRTKSAEDKYRFTVDPLSRLLIHCKRQGVSITEATVICFNHPSSRALVNAVGFGVRHIHYYDAQPDHGVHGPESAQALEEKGILTVTGLINRP